MGSLKRLLPLSQMVEAAAKAEPGADSNLVIVKDVNTRFGMSRTTGTALIYGSSESKSVEPDYVIGITLGEITPQRKITLPWKRNPRKSDGQPESRKVMPDGWIRRKWKIQAIKIRSCGWRTGQEGNSLPPTRMRPWCFSRGAQR